MAKSNFSKLINSLAFIGLIIIAIVLVLQKFMDGQLLTALHIIGEAIAYLVTAITAYFYVQSKRGVWWYVAYFVALALIVVFMVLRAN